MKLQRIFASLSALLWASLTDATCYDPDPTFPPPIYHNADPFLLDAFSKVQDSLNSLLASPNHNTTSFSIQVTSTESTLWSSYHTAVEHDSDRPGAKEVQGDSAFRIASITKTFTTLALLQLHKAGKLALDDPVTTYLPKLAGSLPWKDITLRILASQLSGIPRDWSQGDLSTEIPETWRFGLPPARQDKHHLPNCSSFSHNWRPCGEADLYHALKKLKPVFAPNAKSTYSNTAFEILGLVIARVSGLPYEEYIQTQILAMMGMKSSSFTPPADEVAVLPKNNAWFWDVDEGIHNPTGGLYSTADDLSLYLRYILTHFNALATGVNWLQPHSFAFGGESFYGMPWEIFRTTKLLGSGERPVTFYTKSGGEPGYVSIIIAVPEFGLGFSILVAGEQVAISGLLGELREEVTVPIMRAAEVMAEKQARQKYAGTFVFDESADPEEKLNSSLKISYVEGTGLVVTDFISNGTEVFKMLQQLQPSLKDPRTKAQLLPTLLYADEEKQVGEKWRILITPPRKDLDKRGVWDGMCITDVDNVMYDGNPLNEVTLWSGNDGRVDKVELRAFRVKLKRQETAHDFLVQEL